MYVKSEVIALDTPNSLQRILSSMQGSLPTKRDLIENSSTSCIGTNQLEVTVQVSTDQFGFENKFEIKDMITGSVVVSKLLEGSTESVNKYCVPCSRYQFTMFDEHGDGFYDGHGYKLTVDGKEIANVGFDSDPFPRKLLNDTSISKRDEHRLLGERFTQKSHMFVGTSCAQQTIFFRMKSEYVFDGTEWCIQPKHGQTNARIVVRPCVKENDLQYWQIDNMGQFRSRANSSLCMARERRKLYMGTCSENISRNIETFFLYNFFNGQVHTLTNPFQVFTVPNNLEVNNKVKLTKPKIEEGIEANQNTNLFSSRSIQARIVTSKETQRWKVELIP